MKSMTNGKKTHGLKWHGWTDRGRVRPNNEDAFIGIRFDGNEVHHLGKIGDAPFEGANFAFAVSDGMGGANAGELASKIAVEKITLLLPRLFKDAGHSSHAEALQKLYHQVHRALTYVGGSYQECHGMETTLSVCWFTPRRMHFAHIGDTRIYHLPSREGGIKQISEDDTHVGWLYRNKKISEREARSHPRRKILQRALGGTHQFINPQLGSVACKRGDMFLLCTDGLVEGLHDEHLAEHLREPDFSGPDSNLARRLVRESVSQDGRDNTTALVIQVL